MIKNTFRYLSAVAAIAYSAPATSQWTDISDETTCGFAATFDGPGDTMFIVMQDQKMFDDNTVAVLISNDNWSIKSGDYISDVIKVDADSYAFWDTPTATDNGLILLMEPKHVKAFADSHPSSAIIYKGKLKIDQLNFSGFWGAYLTFDGCVDKKRKVKAERERLDSINKLPTDPFAK